MNNTEYQEVIVCDCCKKPYAKWHHANRYNSSKFCDICGSYCSTRTLADYEIKRLEVEHKDFLEKQARERGIK